MTTSLGLLCAYDSEESDASIDEDRGQKRQIDGTDYRNAKKIKQEIVKPLLPLPNILKPIKTEDDSDLNNPNLHEGRIRSFAHERGNWATYVYIPYETNALWDVLANKIKEQCPYLSLVDDFHISLSKTFVLRHHWIESFIETIKSGISNFESFQLHLDDFSVYCNEEKTRTFLGVKVTSGVKYLKDLLKVVDASLEEFKLPLFYKNPSFHMSILWCVGNKYSELQALLPQLQKILSSIVNNDNFESNCMSLDFEVNKILCKTGNKIYTFLLL